MTEKQRETNIKVDKFYKNIESMRNKQKCTGSKSFSIIHNEVGVIQNTYRALIYLL